MKLYNFPRSSASYRVRIACALKGLELDTVLVNFRDNAQRSEDYLKVAPSGLVPALETDQTTLTQSLAIIRYLDRAYPETPLMIPLDRLDEARVLEMALTISCDVHPINNLRVLNYIKNQFSADEAAVNAWVAEWIILGFSALEEQVKKARKLSGSDGEFCYGNAATLADVCLVPQMFNARRFNVPLDDFPTLQAIDAQLNQLSAFKDTAP